MNMKTKITLKYVLLVTISGNLLGLVGDCSTAWPSPVLPKLTSNDTDVNPLGHPINSDQQSWIGSLNSMGAMLGLYPTGILSDMIGRKPTLLLLAIPHFTAFILYAFANNISLYYIGRVLNGISVSAVYVILPMYIAEISEDHYRGILLASFSIFTSFGDFFTYLIGPYLSILWFDVILAIFPAVFFISFFLLAPESPYYYVLRKDTAKAKNALLKIRPNADFIQLDQELSEIKEEIRKAKEGKIWDTLRSKAAIKGSAISILLATLQQFSGVVAFQAYTQQIFEEAGTNVSADKSAIIVGSVFFGATLICPFIIDRKGRKFLLITSLVGLILADFTLGLYYYLKDNAYDVGAITWIPILCLMIFMFMFNIGFGPLPLTIVSEILPVNIKFMVATTAGFFSWLGSFLVSRYYSELNDVIGRSSTSWMFTSVCAVSLLFVIFFVPETKGKSFQEIQEILSR